MSKEVKPKRTRRGNGAGQMFARGGVWVLRWTEAGRVRQETTTCSAATKTGRAAAEALLDAKTRLTRLKDRRDRLALLIAEYRDVNAEIARLEGIAAAAAASANRAKLGQLVALWRASPRRRDCSPRMLEIYEQQLAAFVAWAGEGVEIAAVDDGVAEKYAAHLGANVSGSTYNKHINALAAAWRAVARSAGVTANPWEGLPRKRLEGHSRRALTKEEIAAVFAAAEGEWRRLVAIGLFTGLRLGDAVRLKWSAIRDGKVEIVTHKTGAAVCIPVAPRLAEMLGKPDARGGYVCPELADLYARDAARLSKRIGALFERAGLTVREKRKGWAVARPSASFHSLRHTFVSRCVESGVPVGIVRALVGHASASMTEHYVHISAEGMAAAFASLAE